MPSTEYQGLPISSIGRSILTLRREQVHAMDAGGGGAGGDCELESFQRHVADLLASLLVAASSSSSSSGGGGGDLLSVSWIRKLLEAFLVIQDEFCGILSDRRAILVSRPNLDRLVTDLFERMVKALDVCNAIRDGIDQVRQWRNHSEIIVTALDPNQKAIGGGQIRRAKKALTDLTISMLDEKECGSVLSHRNRSFGRCKDRRRSSGGGSHFRSLSWTVSRSWSASRQLHAIAANLSAPRGNEITATSGLAIPVYTMSSVLLFVMWALVAAIPCQDRGLQTHFSVPRNFTWGPPLMSLHEKILEESRKGERKNSTSGLLKEIRSVEKRSRRLIELTDNIERPIGEEDREIRECVNDLKGVCDDLKNGLDPLERQVREVFHRIVKSRAEGLDCLSQDE